MPRPGYVKYFQDAEKLEERRGLGPLRYLTMFCMNQPIIPVKSISVKSRPPAEVQRKASEVQREAAEVQGEAAAASGGQQVEIDVDKEMEQKAPLLAAAVRGCRRTIVDGTLRQCKICEDAAAASTNDASSSAASSTIVQMEADQSAIMTAAAADDLEVSHWSELPKHFFGPKSSAIAVNVPQVALIDFKDPRFAGLHIGNGRDMVATEVEHGCWQWTKMMLALFHYLEQNEMIREPQFCREYFSEVKISIDVDEEEVKDEDVNESGVSKAKLNVNADGEVIAYTNNVYIKVHGGLFDMFGTGTVEGHPKVDGQATLCQYRCFVYTFLIIVLMIFVAIFVGIGYLISYLAS